ncbi:uncharacterized protein JCM15063_003733 [Sporobolomyces koalae]|uniref:uncharacterized protein n=1 Tax=Sporobolomyces koalae TaxID=500713 RepID=UPI003175E209
MSARPLVLVRTDEIGRRGEVRTTLFDSTCDFPLFTALSQYTPALEGHKTTLYARQSQQVGSVSLDYFQLGKSREIKSTAFYTRANFFSDKLVWRTLEGQQLRWKRDNSGQLILIDHKTRQTLASAQTMLLSTGKSRTTIKIHPSLLPQSETPNSRIVTPMESPASISSVETTFALPVTPTRLKRQSMALLSPKSPSFLQSPTPPKSASSPNRATSGSTTLELVILSLLHQDYLGKERERQMMEEADERSNEWDPW